MHTPFHDDLDATEAEARQVSAEQTEAARGKAKNYRHRASVDLEEELRLAVSLSMKRLVLE